MNLLILDCNSHICNNSDTIVYWSKFTNESNIVSIPFLLKENSDEIKSQYLSLIYEVGEISVKGKTIIEHLKIRNDFSFWWLTLFTEKCNFAKSKHIDQILKLFVFNKWITDNPKISSISIITKDIELNKIIKKFCKKKKIIFKTSNRNSFIYLSFQHNPLFIFFNSIWWLFKFFVKNLNFFLSNKNNSKSLTGVSFFSYFTNLDKDLIKKNIFKSQYWASLPEFFDTQGINSNWVHFFVKSGNANSLIEAKKIILSFNSDTQKHYLFESFYDLSIFVESFIDWFKVILKYFFLKRAIKSVLPYNFEVWRYFRKDLNESIFGVSAIDNLLRFNTFNKISNFISKQNLGVYLQENQGWEISLAYSWNKAGNNNLIGFPHSTVRYWDLRYFHDSRNFIRNTKLPLPLPDYVACSGPVIKDIYTRMGYPLESLIEVEALRYLKFENSLDKINVITNNKNSYDLLVLGDYLIENTVELLTILYRTIPLLDRRFNIIFKPHPACLVDTIDVAGVKIDTSIESIDKLLTLSRIALTSSTTSASVDAYLIGNKVISVYNGKNVDLSPFYDISGIDFISNETELAFILNNMNNNMVENVNKNVFFYLDSKLPKWKKMIKELI